jgi:hypothetical protein
MLEGIQFKCCTIRKGSDKIGVQALVDPWRVDDMEGGNGESKSGCFDASADNNLGLVCKALLCLVSFWKLRFQYLLEDGLFGIICLQRLATHDTANVVPLILEESVRVW